MSCFHSDPYMLVLASRPSSYPASSLTSRKPTSEKSYAYPRAARSTLRTTSAQARRSLPLFSVSLALPSTGADGRTPSARNTHSTMPQEIDIAKMHSQRARPRRTARTVSKFPSLWELSSWPHNANEPYDMATSADERIKSMMGIFRGVMSSDRRNDRAHAYFEPSAVW